MYVSKESKAVCREVHVFRPYSRISDLDRSKDGRLVNCHEPGTFYLSYLTNVYESFDTVGNAVGKLALLNLF